MAEVALPVVNCCQCVGLGSLELQKCRDTGGCSVGGGGVVVVAVVALVVGIENVLTVLALYGQESVEVEQNCSHGQLEDCNEKTSRDLLGFLPFFHSDSGTDLGNTFAAFELIWGPAKWFVWYCDQCNKANQYWDRFYVPIQVVVLQWTNLRPLPHLVFRYHCCC